MAATKEHERRLTLRLKDGDLADVHRAARARGTSVQRFVLDVVLEAVSREDEPPVLDSWDAVRALQDRMANGTASEADRYAFVHSFDDYELTDEDRGWLDADLGGVTSNPELDGENA
jgi:hypothetical protein